MRLALGPALALCLCTSAQADVEADTKLIAETLFSHVTLEAVFQVLQPIISSAIVDQFRTAGVTVSDPPRYTRIFIAEFRNRYAEIMRAEIGPVLADMFTEQELSDIATFIQTPSGKKFFAAQGDLSQAGARIGQVAGARAGQEAAERIAKRMEAEGIHFTGPDGDKLDTLRFLRGY
jgi:hypothetical protein